MLFIKDKELEKFREEIVSQAVLKEEVKSLKQERTLLSKRVGALESELYGARLAAKYLDKELAGRYHNQTMINLLVALSF